MYDQIMASFAMHISLSEEEQQHIQAMLEVRELRKNEALLSAGHICKAIYFVNRGCLRTYHIDDHGNEHTLSFSPENWWGVDVVSFSSQTRAIFSIEATEDSEVVKLTKNKLDILYKEVPKLERFFRILTENGYRLYQNRNIANVSLTAEERYLLFKEQYPHLEHRIAQKDLASYLGITPVYLSRLRKRMIR